LEKKWNWENVTNLEKENEIFNKVFGENIMLRPLEIRTFVFVGIGIDTELCKKIEDVKYSNKQTVFNVNKTKPMPKRKEE
jgi:hypothetical protein